jgi:DNA-3-methyladenine glycosylase II
MNATISRKLALTDPVMARLIKRCPPMDFQPRRLPPYESLIQAVIYQQLSGKAASTILKRVLALFPAGVFPTPAQLLAIDEQRLRGAGLSRPKVGYLRNIAEHAQRGEIPSLADCDGLTDAAIIEGLTRIKGVGRWTVEMMLIFNLGRPDVLPVHDLGVRKGFMIAYAKRKLPDPEQLHRYGERWAPYRTAAAWYLWRATELKK